MILMNLSEQTKEKWLKKARTIAVIGCSDNSFRTSFQIARYLQNAGYRIIPVNPNITETLGEKAYPSIDSLPDGMQIDIVDIFRNKKYTTEMVDQVVRWSGQTGQKPLLWTQLDVSSIQAKKRAVEAGLSYVENECLMVEHKRLLGNSSR